MSSDRNVSELFASLVEHLSRLFRKEVQLARAEATEKMQQATGALASIAIGGAVLLAALIVLLHSAVAWLVVLGLEVQWSTLVVALVVGLVGFLLLQRGTKNLKASNLTPRRTLEQVQHDAHTVREQVR